MHNWFQILDLPFGGYMITSSPDHVLEMVISCFPKTLSLLKFSTPNKTLLNTQPEVSFPGSFPSAP